MNWYTRNGLVDPVGSNIEALREQEYYETKEDDLENRTDNLKTLRDIVTIGSFMAHYLEGTENDSITHVWDEALKKLRESGLVAKLSNQVKYRAGK